MAAFRLQHEALQQKRDAVIALARHAARNAVRRQLQAQGVRVALVPLSVITAQANVYLRAHSAELFAEAQATAERRAAESVRKDQRNRTLAVQAQRDQKKNQQWRTLRQLLQIEHSCGGPNSTFRLREYLTEAEVDRLIDAARKRSRSPERDAQRSSWRTGMGYGRRS